MTGAQRRSQLIDVAAGVFAMKGYEAASIEEIAERADVSKPVVYEHFPGKEALYGVVVHREVDELTARITQAFEADDPRFAADRAAATFLAYIEERELGFRILVRDAPVGSGAFASVIASVAVATEDLLADEFDARGLDPASAPMYARMLVGAVALVGEWWVETRSPPREQVAAHIVNLLWRGLRGLQAHPEPRRGSADRSGADRTGTEQE